MTLEVPELTQKLVGSTEESIRLQTESPVVIGAVNHDISEISYRLVLAPFAFAPVKDGEELGRLEYYFKNTKICSVPLLADGSAEVRILPEKNKFMQFLDNLRSILKNA